MHLLLSLRRALALGGIALLSLPLFGADQHLRLTSPSGRIEVTLSVPDDATSALRYTVTKAGRPIVRDSALALELKDGPSVGQGGFTILGTRPAEIREAWRRVWGKRADVRNHANELTVQLREAKAPGRTIHYTFRAYDDGVAFRYELPEQDALRPFAIVSESSEFRFLGNHPVWAANYGGYNTGEEAHFESSTLDELRPFLPYGAPVLVKVGDDCWVTLTEANVTDWASAHLTHSPQRPHTLVTTLSPRLDDPTIAVRSASVRHSPWRVIMIADSAVGLMESDLVQNLNAPCAIADTSWIRPGKAAWDRWWSNDYLPDASFKSGMNQATMKYFIDFAADMGWPYQIVDWQWYGEPFVVSSTTGADFSAPNPNADITKSIPAVDIPELVRYAQAKGVKLFLWLEWHHADRQMDVAFPLYEKWGVAGVKIDFMNRTDQEMMNFYQRCVKKAAQHRLLVDFHGATKPDGWSRTYPNIITREGVLGNEYTKWSDRVTPDHCLTLPFTRGVLGEMDFTPGGWRQKTKDTFRTEGKDNPSPHVMGTRCYQLAMFVVYESAFQVVCDSPYNYRSSPAGLDFLKIVPTTWDDTKAITGAVGDYVAIARRSGDTWYLGAMTDWTARTLDLPLTFLGEGEYEAEIWRDAYEANEYPDRLLKETRRVRRGDTLPAVMSPGGGYVAVLRRK